MKNCHAIKSETIDCKQKNKKTTMIHEFVEHTIALKVQNNQMNFYISNTMASILYDEKNKLTY